MGQDVKRLDPLWVQRAILCDLLIGRWMRGNAAGILERAIETEAIATAQRWSEAECKAGVDGDLEAATGLERIGMQSEQGLILWGGRYNRQGLRPEDGG